MIAQNTAVRTAVAALAALVLALAAWAGEPAGVPMTNADIVSMTRANVPPAAIVGRIQSSPNNFDLSDQAFMELKAGGVADEVLNAMLAAGRAGSAAASSDINLRIPALPPLGGSGRQPGAGIAPPAALTPPALGGSDWSDFGRDLAALPPPPALPAFSAPPGTPAPVSAAPAFTQPQSPAAPQAQSPLRPTAPAPAVAADPFSSYAAPAPASPIAPAPAPVAAPTTTPAQMFSAPPSAGPAGYDAARFEAELAAIANGTPEAKRSSLAWMLANQRQTLPGLRQALAPSSRPDLQAGAAQALAALNDQASLPQMRDLLGSPSPVVRKETARALAQMNDSLAIGAAEQNLGGPVEPLDGLIHLVGYARLVRASERLGSILSGNASAVNRAAAAGALAEIGRGGAAAWPALESALSGDADASVRREAARAVARFHDPSSAELLMNACRRDPEVRKVTLEAMADYPETIEFLVGVVGLGADQIAPDESEAARDSLAKLTGQNFGLDGAQWSAWFAENRTASGAGGFAPAVALSGIPAPAAPAGGAVSGGSQGQVDITALGIIVDPSQIPMAPELGEGFGGGAPADGVLRIPGSGMGLGGAPAALSAATDFGGPGTGAGPAAGVSDSDVGKGRLPTPAGFEEYGDDQMYRGSMSAGGMGGDAPPSTMSSLPQQPVVAPVVPADPVVDSAAGSDSGLRLALPPMPGGGVPADSSDMLSGAEPEYAQTQSYDGPLDAPLDENAVLYDGGPAMDDALQQYTEPSATEYADGGEYDASGALPLPPGDSPDTIAFPGDTDAFGIGEPMFEDGEGGASMDGGTGTELAMPPLPGGESGGAPAETSAADALDGYEYAEYDDGYGDEGGDFASDDFAAFLQESDASEPEPETGSDDAGVMPAPPSGGTERASTTAWAEEGTADWTTGDELPPVGEPYTVESGSGRSGGTTMEWVRGVGLVEKEAPSAQPSAQSAAPADGTASIVVETQEDEGGSWHYVEAPGDSAPAAVEEVVVVEDAAAPSAGQSLRPSRSLRKQR